ncbi:hypothetical protein DFP72DRAFT_848994 [Ephemerocybe angulata]|uniref:Ribonuclease H1 N-terminal domain-containing protein n=1 Tax=Ephemerocybe angulata TaxID=980116 RepID=A0A8H6HV22_9AGAR|nr:hypothetical protein DFP72DRAFT_848994 [Tulosesus angulatus]
MAKQSSSTLEHRVFRRTTLSLPMQELLGAVIRAFDARRYMVNAAAQGEVDYHPETCAVCNGTGFLLVPNLGEGETSDSDEDVVVKAEDSEGESQFASPLDPTPAPEAAGTTHDAAAAAVSAALASALAAATITATGGNTDNSVPAPTVPTGTIIPPAAPAMPQITTLNALGLSAPVSTPPGPVYAISAVLPGFESVGPMSANPQQPPEPANAVFTGPGEDRYYVITKGIRVGVFGGWQSTSPYVTGVASASFSRHRTLQGAYQAYETAYLRGSVLNRIRLAWNRSSEDLETISALGGLFSATGAYFVQAAGPCRSAQWPNMSRSLAFAEIGLREIFHSWTIRGPKTAQQRRQTPQMYTITRGWIPVLGAVDTPKDWTGSHNYLSDRGRLQVLNGTQEYRKGIAIYVPSQLSATFSRSRLAWICPDWEGPRSEIWDHPEMDTARRPLVKMGPHSFEPLSHISVPVDMPSSNPAMWPATRHADLLVAAIGFISLLLAAGDIEAYFTQTYLRWVILHGVPDSPPGVDREMFCVLDRMHFIITVYDLATRRRRSSQLPRAMTNGAWAQHRETLRTELRNIIWNQLLLDRYAGRPVTMIDEPIFLTLYGATVPRRRQVPRPNYRIGTN